MIRSLKFVTALSALTISIFISELSLPTLAKTTDSLVLHASTKQLPYDAAAEESLKHAEQLLQDGIKYYRRNELSSALNFLEKALSYFRTERLRITFPEDSRRGEAVSLENLGGVHTILGNFDQAIDLQEQALNIKRRMSDHHGEADSLNHLGNAYHSLGDFNQAINFHQQALDISHTTENLQSEAESLSHLGVVHHSLGDFAQAISLHQESLGISREIGNHQSEAESLSNLGTVYQSLGDYRSAISLQEQSLDIRRQIDDNRGESITLANLGIVHQSLGDIYQSRGDIDDSLNSYEQAVKSLQQSRNIARRVGDRQGEANALAYLGSAYYSLGIHGRATNVLQLSLNIARQIGDPQVEITSLNNLGTVYRALGKYKGAIDIHQQQLDIARRIGDRLGESSSLHNLGVAFRCLNNFIKATQSFEASALVQESFHSTSLADANRLSLLDSQQITYRSWQTVLMAQEQPQEALVVAERSRAQALAISMSRALVATEDRTWIASTPPDITQIQAIAIQQQATLIKYSVLLNGRILIWVIQPDGSIHSAESTAEALDNSLVATAEVFATLGQNGRGGLSLETPLSELVQNTQSALSTVRSSDISSETSIQLSRQQLNDNLKQLHDTLIKPIEQWLPTDENQKVIFIPHRELFRVPFAALQDNENTYLIEKHTILTAPSIQSLDLARQHKTRVQTADVADALIVGNPTLSIALRQSYGWNSLPGAEDEASEVGNMLRQYLGIETDVLTKRQATETVVKQRLHTARFIHLATHGTLASSVEDNNLLPDILQYGSTPGVLALAATDTDDGSLTADELVELTIDNPLNAELVVLSACQTGQGSITSDGVYGLSRTLLTAGVPTLVVSLWNASDTHTVGLMEEFYRQFLDEDKDKAQALRQAMLKMINEGDSNPQYWAAFTIVGNP